MHYNGVERKPGELSAIGKFCAEKLRAARHEFRTPYISAAANHGDWNIEQLMDEEECGQVRRELMALRVPLVLDIHSKNELFSSAAAPGQTVTSGTSAAERTRQPEWLEEKLAEMRFCMDKEFLFLRFHPSGLYTYAMTKEETSIAGMEDSFDFFLNKLKGLYRRRAEAFLAPDALLETFDTAAVRELPTGITLSGMRENPVYLLLERFFQRPEVPEEFLLFAAATGKYGKKQLFFTLGQPCPEWVSRQKELYGFALCIDRSKIARPLTDLEFFIAGSKSLTPLYAYKYPYGIL